MYLTRPYPYSSFVFHVTHLGLRVTYLNDPIMLLLLSELAIASAVQVAAGLLFGLCLNQ